MKLKEILKANGVDGKDHINVSIFNSSTQLGKLLHPEFRSKFFVPLYGEFISPISFVRWVGGAGEEARHDSSVKGWSKIKTFKESIVYAKFCQMKNLTKKITENSDLLSIRNYTTYKIHPTGVRETDRRWEWFVAILPDLLDQALSKEKVPDFKALGLDYGLEDIQKEIKNNVVEKYSTSEATEEDVVTTPQQEENVVNETSQESEELVG